MHMTHAWREAARTAAQKLHTSGESSAELRVSENDRASFFISTNQGEVIAFDTVTVEGRDYFVGIRNPSPKR